MPKVGIIISNYNGWQDTLVCLESLQRQTFTDFEIILIDDASPNDSVAQLQDKLPPNTVFLPQQRNVGFAAANNIGIRRALADGCDFALLLNNDTAARPDFLEKLLAETPAGAVSCPKMLFMDPPDDIWFAGGALDPKTGRVKHLGGHEKDGPRFAEKKQVSFITFCCVLLPRAVIEQVGYLDETLFMYCEDVDYCLRLTRAGVPLWFLPDAVIHHKAGGSAGGMLSVYYITRNTLYLTCKGRSTAYARLKTILPLLTGAARYALTKRLDEKRDAATARSEAPWISGTGRWGGWKDKQRQAWRGVAAFSTFVKPKGGPLCRNSPSSSCNTARTPGRCGAHWRHWPCRHPRFRRGAGG